VVQPAERQSRPDQGAQVVRETKSDRAAQPMQVAILGPTNLKAALPDEGVAPVEPPRSTDGPAKPESKSACNGGRRIVSAYYWEGHHTASGQPFNPHGMTAAHRTLPFGTRLDVTNPRTGKTVNVLINDRGPYVRGVSLDLSLGAAQAIGLHGTGSVCIL
jgi:rare lipoprotein A